jgi:hypothetical protein
MTAQASGAPAAPAAAGLDLDEVRRRLEALRSQIQTGERAAHFERHLSLAAVFVFYLLAAVLAALGIWVALYPAGRFLTAYGVTDPDALPKRVFDALDAVRYAVTVGLLVAAVAVYAVGRIVRRLRTRVTEVIELRRGVDALHRLLEGPPRAPSSP